MWRDWCEECSKDFKEGEEVIKFTFANLEHYFCEKCFKDFIKNNSTIVCFHEEK